MHAAASMLITVGVAAATVRIVEGLRDCGALSSICARKVMHAGTGLVFLAMWPVFSQDAPNARWWAAAVPAILTAKFVAVGLGLLQDPQLVQSATRTGDRRELLAGPTLYGAVHVLATLLFWTASPAAVIALSALCAGDGLADLAGRRFGGSKLARLPWSKAKSWPGSAACFIGSWAASFVMVSYLRVMGIPLGLPLSAPPETLLAGCAACALAGTIAESLPVKEIDNLTVPAVAVMVSHFVLAPAW